MQKPTIESAWREYETEAGKILETIDPSEDYRQKVWPVVLAAVTVVENWRVGWGDNWGPKNIHETALWNEVDKMQGVVTTPAVMNIVFAKDDGTIPE